MSLSPRSDSATIDPSQLPDLFSSTYTLQYFQVAIVTVLAYDSLLTPSFPKNFSCNSVQVVYFANRYFGIFGAIAGLFCEFSHLSSDLSYWVTIISIDYILMIRVLTLWYQDKNLAIFLKILIIVEAVAKLGFIIYFNVIEQVGSASFENIITVCGEENSPSWQVGLADWVIQLAYAMILMVLALYKASEYWKTSAGFKGFKLIKVVIQDQILYFIFVIIITVFAILGFKLQLSTVFLGTLLNTLGNPSFLCILGSRILINLKDAGEQGCNEGTSYKVPTRTVTEMDFAESINREREIEMEGVGRDAPI
ncbi:hypothetical protein A7U60_g5671 [Sanghuangporus baumii]|uniref:Uncharacterized protein n=1 Tax=Sanghuangporus baumii TaxID=108892 RepID=A0A9Q5HWR1_SANBA|nr:hypothetical protein A7U60_g5671 [Sanghuangporus baumii]